MVGSPIWRPSYRVVLRRAPTRRCCRRGPWCRTPRARTGATSSSRSPPAHPSRFARTSARRSSPERPLVSDTGEVVSSVPTRRDRDRAAGSAPPAMAQAAPAAAHVDGRRVQADRPRRGRSQRADEARQMSERARSRSAASRGAPQPRSRQRRSRAERAARRRPPSAVTESVTRYDLSMPVTIPDGGSTMVAIVSTRVTGEQAHLFAPDWGVPLSRQHPFSVARLRNDTGCGARRRARSRCSRTAPSWARACSTRCRATRRRSCPSRSTSRSWWSPPSSTAKKQGALVRVQRGVVTVQRFSQRKTLYRVRNGGAAATKVYVRHARWGQAELLAPPDGHRARARQGAAPDRRCRPTAQPSSRWSSARRSSSSCRSSIHARPKRSRCG